MKSVGDAKNDLNAESRVVVDPAYAEPDSDRSRIPYANRLVPARPDRVLSWEELNDWPDEDVA